jgi:hypothetical protein
MAVFLVEVAGKCGVKRRVLSSLRFSAYSAVKIEC